LNTLRALEKNGLTTISASRKRPVIDNSSLNYLPFTCTVNQLQEAVIKAEHSSDAQPLIVVLFHSYDFREVDEKRGSTTWLEFSELLDWVSARKDVKLLSIGQATRVIQDLSAHRYQWNSTLHPALKYLPAFMRHKEGENQYSEPIKWPWLNVGVCYFVIIILVVFAWVLDQ